MALKNIPTETRNKDTLNFDEATTLEMVKMINNEDKKVAFEIEKHMEEIARAIDAISKAFNDGGRIIYCGAGTSGRMGFMDSAECPPTFGIESSRVVSLIAGGIESITKANEGAEDSEELCINDLKKINFSNKDIFIGLAASGRTPYVIGGLKYAKEIGTLTVSITCSEQKESPINLISDFPIAIYPGPEVITGSTRMKAGTVQKMVLNMISTCIMAKAGKIFSNLMVNVKPTNEKLVDRAFRIIEEITGADAEKIKKIMLEANNDVSHSIIMILTGKSLDEANDVLVKNNDHIKNAIKDLLSQN